MYSSEGSADEISRLIFSTKEKHNYRRFDAQAQEADIEWGASVLLAKLLSVADFIPNTYISLTELNHIHNEFSSNYGNIDLEYLKAKFWIRVIGDLIEIPTSIGSAVRRYSEIKDAEQEFCFLKELTEKLNIHSNIEKSDFDRFLSDYQNAKDVIISVERCKLASFLSEKDGKFNIQNLEYNQPIFDNKRHLDFISFLEGKKAAGDHSKLIIKEEALARVYKRHKGFFSKTPALETLISQKLITKKDNLIYVNLKGVVIDYWTSLSSKIFSLLWIEMKQSHTNPHNSDLERNWVLKINFIDDLISAPDFWTDKDLTSLLQASTEILLSEKDVAGTDSEIEKLVLSRRRSDYSLLTNIYKIGFPVLEDADNLFSLFEYLEQCNHIHQSDLLWMQESRWYIDKLIQIVVFCDKKISEDGERYPFVRKLLYEGFSRPYLLWKTCFFIYYWRPEIIPYLCTDTRTASLAFKLYFRSETDKNLPPEISAELKNNISGQIFSLILSGISKSREKHEADTTKIIFECLLLIAESKYVEYVKHGKLSIAASNYLQSLFNALAEIIKTYKIDGIYFKSDGSSGRCLLFPHLLPALFTHISKYNGQNIYREGVIGMPVVKFELLNFVLDLVKSNEYRDQKHSDTELKEEEIISQFCIEYLSALSLFHTLTWDYSQGKMIESIPLWSMYQITELVPWHKWVLSLEQYGRLTECLRPSELKLKKTDDIWDKQNELCANKIRTHLEILLTAHRFLRDNEDSFIQQGLPAETALAKIEQAIADFVTVYSVNDSMNAKSDIFDNRHESTLFGTFESALLPVLAQAINKFSPGKKREILKSLTFNDSFAKCLKLLEYLSGEADIEFIKNQIKEFDVSTYLDSKNYIPEIETIVIKLSEYDEFIDKAKQALEYWRERILTQRNNKEYHIIFYRIKLLIAYHESDEDTIINEPAPPIDYFSTSSGYEFVPAETREFYLGLVKLKNNNPEVAYAIFNRLITSSKNEKMSLANNRLFAHIKLAETKKSNAEKEKVLTEALSEWEDFEASIPANDKPVLMQYVQENVCLNKLYIFDQLKRHNDFDNLFQSLDKTYQLRKDFFASRINNYLNRGHYELGKLFVQEAKLYHQTKDGAIPDFIKMAIEKLENEDDYKRLRKEFFDMISRTPEKLVLVLPENIVGKRYLSYFVLKEICNSVNDMLNSITSINNIKHEDKYTDLLILSLKSRLRYWNWEVSTARGGFSESGKLNSGELDFVINSSEKDRIATCEALLIGGKNTEVVTRHINKIFNYDHRRGIFIILVYYNGSNFVKHWNDYKDNIIQNMVFPSGFQLIGIAEEITEPFTNNSIKVILTRHERNTVIYHIMANLNYRLA